jgi:hypothetical protein
VLSDSGKILVPTPLSSVTNKTGTWKMSTFSFKSVGLPKLDDHWPTVIASAVFWQLVWSMGWLVSTQISSTFRKLDTYRKFDWCVHIVSFAHATTIATMAFINFFDPALQADKLFGYTHQVANVYAIACGYVYNPMSHSMFELYG